MTRFAPACAALITLLLLTAIPAAAQVTAGPDVFVGFSPLRDLGTEEVPATDYDRGWVVAVGVPLPWWGLVATGEAGMNSRTNTVDETQQLFAALGGVRMNVWQSSRVALFGQALAGIERFSEPGFDESGPAFQPGGGVDVAIWSRLGARAQFDWRLSQQNGESYRAIRVAFGGVVRLGAR